MKTVSIVVPLYNEELLVDELISRLQKATCGLRYQFEFVTVDDGSRDRTLHKLIGLQSKEPRLTIVKLSRNWGFQNAYNAGIDHAHGDAMVLIDGDLEDPPEMIAELLQKWEEGYEVVYTVKESRHLSVLDRILYGTFYKLLRMFSSVTVEQQAGMFSLLDRKAADQLRRCAERNKYYVGLRSFIGFRQIGVPFHRDKRFAGTPKQSFRRLLNYALNAYFSFSFLPIRIMTYFGIGLLAFILVASVVLVVGRVVDVPLKFFQDIKNVPGWTTLVLLILFLMGTQIIFIGILGEYIARVFDEVRNRPYYIVDAVYRADKTGGMAPAQRGKTA
jgi:dolichol-phosphate mannosyltransferase